MLTYWVPFAFKLAATGLAIAISRKRLDHRPVAVFLGVTAIIELIRLALLDWVIRPARASLVASGLDPTVVPFTGWIRVACDIDGALFLMWPAGLAALAVWVYTKRRPWPIAVVYVLTAGALIVTYPAIRYDALRKVYLAAELASLTVAVGVLGQWFWREVPRLPHVIVACIIIIELAQLVAGPWRIGIFGAWTVAQVIYAVLYVALTIIQGVALCIKSDQSTTQSK